MSCFTLEYLGFHQIAYAHALQVENYRFSFSTTGFGLYRERKSEVSGLMEIGYVLHNPLVIENRTLSECYTAQEGDIFLFPPGHEIAVHAQNPGEHKHITSEYMIDAKVVIHRGDGVPAVDSGADGRSITLPYLIPAGEASRAAIAQIQKIAADYTLLTEKSFFRQSSEFCSLIEFLRRCSDPAELKKPYLSPRYKSSCRKAEQYIEDHLAQAIRIQKIADAVGISKNYLISIFSEYKGMGLTEYIHRVKLNHVLLLVRRYGYSIRQAGEATGYHDANYVSRIFPKYYGVPLQEYLKMNFGNPGSR